MQQAEQPRVSQRVSGIDPGVVNFRATFRPFVDGKHFPLTGEVKHRQNIVEYLRAAYTLVEDHAVERPVSEHRIDGYLLVRSTFQGRSSATLFDRHSGYSEGRLPNRFH